MWRRKKKKPYEDLDGDYEEGDGVHYASLIELARERTKDKE